MREKQILCFILCASIVWTKHYYSCKSISQSRISQQQQLREDISISSNAIFSENNYTFTILNQLYGNSFPWQLISKRVKFQIKFNFGYLISIAILFACWIAHILLIRFGKSQNFSFNRIIERSKWRKVMVLMLCVICFFVFAESCKGIDESEKLKSSLEEIYCKMLVKPRGLIKGSDSQVGYESLIQLQKDVDRTIRANIAIINPLAQKALRAQDYLKIAQIAVRHLQSTNETSSFFHEFKQSLRHLKQMYNSGIYGNFFHMINEEARIMQFVIKTIKNIRFLQKWLQHYEGSPRIQGTISVWSFLSKAFFFLLIFLSITITSFLTYNNFRKKKNRLNEKLVTLLQALLRVFVCVLTVSFIVSSIAIAASGAIYSSTQAACKSAEQLFKQVENFEHPHVPLGILMLSPFNITLRMSSSDRYMKKYNHFVQYYAPYSQRQPTYFYDMLNESLSYIKDERVRQQVVDNIEVRDSAVREPFAAYLKEVHQSFKTVLETREQGVFDRLNGGEIGHIIRDFLETSSLLIVNRGFQSHQICGRLIVLLLAAFLLFFIMHSQETGREQNNTQESKLEQSSKTKVESQFVCVSNIESASEKL